MQNLLRTLDQWTTYQDYLWFLAMLAWGGVSFGLWRNSAARARPWFAVWALASLASASLELVLLSVHDRSDRYWIWDRLMAAALGASAGALFWGALAERIRGRRHLAAVVALGVALAATWLRNQWPVPGGLAIALITAVSVRLLLPSGKGAKLGLLAELAGGLTVFVFWPLFATHGPLAHATGPGRIGEDYSRFALVAASTLALAGLLAARAVWRDRLIGTDEFRPNLRRHFLVLAVWLAIGFGLMLVSGTVARREYEDGLRARVRTATLALDGDVLERAIGPALQSGWFERRPAGNGTAVEVMHTSTAGRPEFVALRDALARIESANPDLRYANLVTIRGGRLISVMVGRNQQPTLQRLLVLRPAEPEDFLLLHRREPLVIGPIKDVFGERIAAQCPVYGTSRQVALGWLVLHVPSSRWLAAFAQVRLQTMGIVAVGVLLWGMVLAHDLRRFATEAETRRAAAAIEADRLKSAFLAMVSHELRTPIQSVLGYAELLAGEKLPPTTAQWITALRSHGQTMHQLVNDLIDTGALQCGSFRLHARPASLRGIVEDAVAAIRPAALGKGLQLHSEFDESLPATVLCDPVRVRQILLNLLANAVKFTSAGEVRLRAGTAAGGSWTLTVSDTGPGIPPERRGEMFRPFARLGAPSGSEGTGLGLALVARLAESMNGRIRHEDGASGGTTFVVTLPLAAVDTTPGPQIPPAGPTCETWRGVRFLVAEDNTLVRELLVTFLSRHGAHVVAVADGPAALAAARQDAFAVVLLDWMMPGADGLTVARALRAASGSRTPFIIGLSAHAGDAALADAHAAGMNVFLAKPVALSDLAHAIAQAPGLSHLPNAHFDGEAALFATLQARFSSDLRALLDDIIDSARSRDRSRLRARVHYLKNSADIVGAAHLGRACQEVLDDAESADAPAFDELAARIAAASRNPFAASDAPAPSVPRDGINP